MVYTGVRRVTVGPDETIVELHDATEGRCPVRLTPMGVQEVLEALAQALVQIRGAQPALERPLHNVTAWTPLVNAVHDAALLLTTSAGLRVRRDASMPTGGPSCGRISPCSMRRRSRSRCTDARMSRQPYTVLWPPQKFCNVLRLYGDRVHRSFMLTSVRSGDRQRVESIASIR